MFDFGNNKAGIMNNMKLIYWCGDAIRDQVTLGKTYSISNKGNFCADDGGLRDFEQGQWEYINDEFIVTNEVLGYFGKKCEVSIGNEENVDNPDGLADQEYEDNSNIKYDDIPNQTTAQAIKWRLAHPEEDQALRYNTGKSQLSYMLEADVAMKGMCSVFEFGAKKYARSNWKKGLSVNEIMDSLLRHMTALANGEVIDPESRLPHVDHITCNAVFLATFGERVNKGPDTRDML
jgi:hypothetical protein